MKQLPIKEPHKEWRVLVVLFMFVLILEFGIRSTEQYLSGNIAHILHIPEIASDINNTNGSFRN